MEISPKKKKAKLNHSTEINKRATEIPHNSPRKRFKEDMSEDEGIKARKRKNFITACELVSYRDYFDHRARLLLAYLPKCMKLICKHHDRHSGDIQQMSSHADEAFKTEMRNNDWKEALEVCFMCINAIQYLSTDVLKGVVEIMLNVHEDKYSKYSAKCIVDKCQTLLIQNFCIHPPCLVKGLKNNYNKFLTSPMFLKENTFSNRTEFECQKGIVKYCMTRLEHELSFDSQDGPLFHKEEKIPEEMKWSVMGLHWQKEKFEIFELLNREERIERLFAVLESLMELLQFDLAIWHSRYTNDLGRHIMRSHKPLMAYYLWSENALYTGAVTNNCRQILRIFAHMVHLQYPDSNVKIITTWLNTMIQTFYICEQNSNMDYPNTGKYCSVFAKDFYFIIKGLPHDSIIRILERIYPMYMRYLLGLLHTQNVMPTGEKCILKILIDFVSEQQWKSYPPDNTKIVLSNRIFVYPKTSKDRLGFLRKKWTTLPLSENNHYPKMEAKIEISRSKVSLNHLVHTLYVTLHAYLEAYDVKSVEDTWANRNEEMLNGTLDTELDSILSAQYNYSVTESLIKKYRYIYKSIKELEVLLSDLKNKGKLPEMLKVFAKIKSIYF